MSAIQQIAKELHTTAGYLIEGEKMELDEDVMQIAALLQSMPEQLRKVSMEQVKLMAGLSENI